MPTDDGYRPSGAYRGNLNRKDARRMTMSNDSTNGQPPVTFTIDGVEYTSDERRRPAAELLSLSGLNAEEHDLARVVGQGQVEKPFEDDDIVQLTPGAKYVSIFIGPTPVV